MCGIFFYKGLGGTIDRNAYDKALSWMDYRGPDNRDIYFGNDYVIGHTRLAIIDVSLDANQPFWSNDKRYIISFNGEIYNYEELQRKLIEAGYSMRTNSDTEVLLEFIVHYGLDTTLECVRGMFAFVFYDTLTERTIAVRDHFGQKPLYYFEENGKFAVASSIRSILAFKENLGPNVESYITYLCTRGIIHPEDTFFSGIKCLPAGRILIYDKGSLVKQEYFNAWNLYSNELPYNKISIDDALSELDVLLEQSVRRHLVSDVPVGILLSGGIDSTLLYWYAHDINDNLTAFTKTSPGIENIPMDIVPQILKNKMSKCLFTLEQEKSYLTVLVDFINSSHSPSKWGGGPPMYRLCAEARKLGVHVLLGGDCADEYFAGYNEHEDVFSKFDGDLFKLDKCVDIQRESPFYSEKYCGRYESYHGQTRRRILDHLSEINDPFEKFFHASLLHDTSVFLQSCVLQHSDAYSMMASVELRNPMLDIDLVSFVCNLPSNKIFVEHSSNNHNKYLLRVLASRKIGDFVNVPKEGTRNYSMKISDHSFWDFDRFVINEITEIPLESIKEKMSQKLIFSLLNLEIFHRLYFLGDEDPTSSMLTEEGKRAITEEI